MVDTARLIVTLDCERNCHYCCNTTKMLDAAISIGDLTGLDNFSTICITGGEPMLVPDRTLKIIKWLKERNQNRKVYLYTAKYTDDLLDIFPFVDGVQYTLHVGATKKDIIDFEYFQYLIGKEKNKSFRAYIDPEVIFPVSILPAVWNQVKTTAWKIDCPLPIHEKLFIWSEK